MAGLGGAAAGVLGSGGAGDALDLDAYQGGPACGGEVKGWVVGVEGEVGEIEVLEEHA